MLPYLTSQITRMILTAILHTKIVAVGGRLNDTLSPPVAHRPGDMLTVTELKASGRAGV